MKNLSVTPIPATDFYAALGRCSTLMCSSELHGNWPLTALLAELEPPLRLGQYQLYTDNRNQLIGLVTWAWVDPITAGFLRLGGSPLPASAWCSGDLLYIADFIAPWGHARAIMRCLRQRPDCPDAWFGVRRSSLGLVTRAAGTSMRTSMRTSRHAT